jgi:hypothetical protein
MGGIIASATDSLHADDEVAKFNIGPAELWQGKSRCVLG